MPAKSAHITATEGGAALLRSGKTTLHGVNWGPATASGTVALQNSTASGGTALLTVHAGTTVNNMPVEGGGIAFDTGVFAKTTTARAVTIIHATTI